MDKQQLIEQIKKKESFLCVGLDSDIEKLPKHLQNAEDPVFEFNKQIIQATNKYAVAYKLNTAFYEANGINGWISFEKTVKYILNNYPEMFIIADAKRGDIGNTSKMYAKCFFNELNCHAVTVAPYMGEDSVSPFLEYKDNWTILLGLTSNKGADDFQFLGEEELYKKVIKKATQWATDKQLMIVVGATRPQMLTDIRKIANNYFLLVPGVGAQGGSLQEVAKYGMNKDCGLLVNSSRGIIFADTSENFAKVAEEKSANIQQEMSALLKEHKVVE